MTTNADVAVADEDTGVVNRLGVTSLEDTSLETTFQKLVQVQTQDQIELLFIFGEDTETSQTAQQGTTFEETTRVLGIESEQFTSSRADLRQDVLNAPDFTLVAETEFVSGNAAVLAAPRRSPMPSSAA